MKMYYSLMLMTMMVVLVVVVVLVLLVVVTMRVISRNLKLGGYSQMFGGCKHA